MATNNKNKKLKIIDLNSIQIKNQLSKNIWEKTTLKNDVRKKLIHIVKSFISEQTNLENIKIKDITLTGSMANYNWSKYSDIDLHIIISADDKLNIELLNSKAKLWNNKYNITIKDHPVEIYIQDHLEPHYSSGVYSIAKNQWINRPSYLNPIIDINNINSKANNLIDSIYDKINDKDCNLICIDNFINKIKLMRKIALEKNGEMAIENLVFKILRRNGIIDLLYNKRKELLEDELTLENEVFNENNTPNCNLVHDLYHEVINNPNRLDTLTRDQLTELLYNCNFTKDMVEKIKDLLAKMNVEPPLEKPVDGRYGRSIY